MNKKPFFDYIRNIMFSGKLNQSQVFGIDYLLDNILFEDVRYTAYMFATVHHETGRTMQPIEEWGKGKNYPYGVPDSVTGKTYYGRGYVQLTWKTNYEKMGDLLGIPLVQKPELALVPRHALDIMVLGMTKGLFTGTRLDQYFTTLGSDWVHARRIINGMDKADMIASYARNYHRALKLIHSSEPGPQHV